jgi:hypothetical protein
MNCADTSAGRETAISTKFIEKVVEQTIALIQTAGDQRKREVQ